MGYVEVLPRCTEVHRIESIDNLARLSGLLATSVSVSPNRLSIVRAVARFFPIKSGEARHAVLPSQVHFLVFFSPSRQFFPYFRAGINDRRLVGLWNGTEFYLVEGFVIRAIRGGRWN